MRMKFSATVRRRPWVAGAAVLAAGLWFGWGWMRGAWSGGSSSDPRVTTLRRGPFEDLVRIPPQLCTLQPVNQERIIPKVRGTLLRLVDDGFRVEKDAVLMQIDPKPHEEALVRQVANLRRIHAEREKEKQTAAKERRKAQVEVESRALRAGLEALRLKELELGPSATEEIDALNKLEAAKNLFQARKEECEILASLALDGFVSQAQVRQKTLERDEQELQVAAAELGYKKLHTPDPVKLAEQRLKVRDEEKNRDAAQERVKLLEKNNQQAEERHAVRLKREEARRVELEQNVVKTRVLAPTPGVALVSSRNGIAYGPGQDVYEGREVMTLSDPRAMKAVLYVDEGRIAKVHQGQKASVRPAGLGGRAFSGLVSRVAEKGRDEFEEYRQETKDIVGKANRQVFEVEVTIDGEPAGVRPGLRAEVDIVIQRLESVLLVPRSALVREGAAEPYVRLDSATAPGPERKTVKVLAENDLYGAVEGEGLDEGARVWLVKP